LILNDGTPLNFVFYNNDFLNSTCKKEGCVYSNLGKDYYNDTYKITNSEFKNITSNDD
jgi:hypothetical protein